MRLRRRTRPMFSDIGHLTKIGGPKSNFSLPRDRGWVSGGANSACAARRFAREAFAHEPIHHQLGLNLKFGWCGLHDCAGPPSLPARNPAVNFGCDWWVVDVAVDRGAIRHDALPQAKWTTAKARIKGCYRLGVLTIGSKDICRGCSTM